MSDLALISHLLSASVPSQPTQVEECPPLDVNSVQFKNGVNNIRDFLRIPPHHDYLQVPWILIICFASYSIISFAISFNDYISDLL